VANLLRLGIFGVLIFGGVVAFLFRDRLSTDAQDTRVGDCIEVPASGEFTSLQHRPCTEPHDGEVFFEIDYPDQDTLPTVAQFDAFVERECLASRFQAYTGLTYQQATTIDATYFSPTTDSWPRGDREIVCILMPAAGGKVSQSYRNG
jgi:hypothetical protein